MDFLGKIDGLSPDQGIRFCGSEQGWLTILKSFSGSLPGTLDEIDLLFASGSREECARLVHGIKSSLRAIGASDLSDRAAGLEQALKQQEAVTDEDISDLTGACRRLCDQIAPAFAEEIRELPEASEEMLSDAFPTMSEFLSFYDYRSMEMVIKELKKYSIPSEYADAYSRFVDAYQRLDRDGMADALAELRK